MLRPGCFTPRERDQLPIVYEAGRAPGFIFSSSTQRRKYSFGQKQKFTSLQLLLFTGRQFYVLSVSQVEVKYCICSAALS